MDDIGTLLRVPGQCRLRPISAMKRHDRIQHPQLAKTSITNRFNAMAACHFTPQVFSMHLYVRINLPGTVYGQ